MNKTEYKQNNLTIKATASMFQVAPLTITNWVKEGLLEFDENHRVTYQSVQRFKARCAGKIKLKARANKKLKDVHDPEEVSRIIQLELVSAQFDEHIGDRYEAMLSESYRNKEGITYTPMNIIDDMLCDVPVDSTTTFLDPCCGTGNFLIKAIEKGVAPENLYGFDTDLNAVLIARRRIVQLTGRDAPNVVCADFLKECQQMTTRFDLAFTNPPWGKKLSKEERTEYGKRWGTGISTDTSSLFLFEVMSIVKPEGIAGLLMPESFFNIAVYEDARKEVLKKNILKITDYGKPFNNMYSACALTVRNAAFHEGNTVVCSNGSKEILRQQSSFFGMPKHILNYWTANHEMEIIEQLMQQRYLTLKDHASWGLGIVTGNNTSICKRTRQPGTKPIYRGKDIFPTKLNKAGLFINPNDFSRCQQVSSMELFHAPEKLIYRFISNELVFYYDTRQRYILNSANMLVLDKDFPLSAKQLAEVLNAPLTRWLFKQLFHTHKVLRGDLEALPLFPDLVLHCRLNLLDFNR